MELVFSEPSFTLNPTAGVLDISLTALVLGTALAADVGGLQRVELRAGWWLGARHADQFYLRATTAAVYGPLHTRLYHFHIAVVRDRFAFLRRLAFCYNCKANIIMIRIFSDVLCLKLKSDVFKESQNFFFARSLFRGF